jgi:hypothetical protein
LGKFFFPMNSIAKPWPADTLSLSSKAEAERRAHDHVLEQAVEGHERIGRQFDAPGDETGV